MEPRYGFIHEKIDMKILILYLAGCVALPIDNTRFAEITTECDGGISYFDFAECVSELVSTGHLALDDRGYSITDKGERICRMSSAGLPYSVRMRADKLAAKTREALRRNALIRTSHVAKTRGGSTVKLSMSDGMGELIKLEILAANEDQSVKMEDHFRKSAEDYYMRFAQMLLDGLDEQ